MGELDICERRPEGRTRRELLLGLIGATAASSPAAFAAGPSPVRKLVDITGYGGTAKDYAAAEELGFYPFLEKQLNPGTISDRHMQAILRFCPTIGYPILQLYSLPSNTAQPELQEATLLRAAFSDRQLYEKMVEFWTNHFNIDLGKSGVLKIVDDREVIRPNALGNFGNLLRASFRSPAMLHYLDNWESWFLEPNQNYAREIMELHTLGSQGGYTQQDVLDVARCFTGHTFWTGASAGALAGQYYFYSFFHDTGQKTVLGHAIHSNQGEHEAEIILEILLTHPSTALNVARKLCQYFLGENPPQSVINDASATFSSTNGDIRSILRTILTKENIAAAPTRTRRPFHYAAGALRRLGAFIYAKTDVRSWLGKMGMPIIACSPPSGYNLSDSYWSNSLLPRWNFAIALMNDQITGISVNVDGLIGSASTSVDIVEKIDRALFAKKMPVALRHQLISYIDIDGFPRLRAREAIAMALASPEQQVY